MKIQGGTAPLTLAADAHGELLSPQVEIYSASLVVIHPMYNLLFDYDIALVSA